MSIGDDATFKMGGEAETKLVEEAKAALQKHIDANPDVPCVAHVVAGSPSYELLRIAREIGARYVVVGTHGRTGLMSLLMGSVAEEVLRTSHLPVLVIRNKTA